MQEMQDKIDKVFKENFGYTPLAERLKDIQGEFFELMKWDDVSNLKEEAGDLLCSLIQLHNESGWKIEDTTQATLDKIYSRTLQYKTLGRKTKVAILGGAFNPITTGHIESAQFVLNTSNEFDEVWLMPAYNHMSGKDMVDAKHRLEMCKIAAEVDGRIKVFDYEIRNKMAGETFNLFKRLKTDIELNEKFNFSMVIGLDNANSFDSWVNFEELNRMVRFVVIPRKGVIRDVDVTWYLREPHIFLNKESHITEISSTEVRHILQTKSFLTIDLIDTKKMDPDVLNYILTNKLY
jgi:nicotinate-nucleotide adenylyltransferase